MNVRELVDAIEAYDEDDEVVFIDGTNSEYAISSVSHDGVVKVQLGVEES